MLQHKYQSFKIRYASLSSSYESKTNENLRLYIDYTYFIAPSYFGCLTLWLLGEMNFLFLKNDKLTVNKYLHLWRKKKVIEFAEWFAIVYGSRLCCFFVCVSNRAPEVHTHGEAERMKWKEQRETTVAPVA